MSYIKQLKSLTKPVLLGKHMNSYDNLLKVLPGHIESRSFAMKLKRTWCFLNAANVINRNQIEQLIFNT